MGEVGTLVDMVGTVVGVVITTTAVGTICSIELGFTTWAFFV